MDLPQSQRTFCEKPDGTGQLYPIQCALQCIAGQDGFRDLQGNDATRCPVVFYKVGARGRLLNFFWGALLAGTPACGDLPPGNRASAPDRNPLPYWHFPLRNEALGLWLPDLCHISEVSVNGCQIEVGTARAMSWCGGCG